MNNNQVAITTAGIIILAIEGAAITICFGYWIKAMYTKLKEEIETLNKKQTGG